MNKLLLVNPPAKERVIRDYYCGHFVKGDYFWAPIDLVMLSRLDDYEIKVIDFMVERDIEGGLRTAKAFGPDIIIGMIWEKICEEDVNFLKKMRELTGAGRLLFVGDAAKFGSPKLKELGIENDSIQSFYHLEDAGLGKFSLPKHHLFLLARYSMPYSLRGSVATVLTTYACPFKCRFCNSGSYPYEERPLADVIRELKEIKKLGVKEIYFRDFTFTANEARVREFCRLMIDEGLVFDWSCDGRVNVAEETLAMMKQAGCYLIFFGVEAADDRLLTEMRKGITVAMMEDAFSRCKKLGIKILASFIVGFPGSGDDDLKKTLDFAKRYCNYASFNVFENRIGADLKSLKGSIQKTKKMEKEFYFRPGYILGQFAAIKTVHQLKNFIKNGLAIFSK